jgi:hypothetical protein
VNSVVASVDVPVAWRIPHAFMPSHVLGILMHTRVVSNAESRYLNIWTIPMYLVSESETERERERERGAFTSGIHDSLVGII